jgi:hypothetical protein
MKVTEHKLFVPTIFFLILFLTFSIEVGLNELGYALVVHINSSTIAGTKPSDWPV